MKTNLKQLLKSDFAYHGTNKDGLTAILGSGFIGTKYHDGIGFYITDDFYNAVNHGQWVLCIPINSIDKELLTVDDTNDGVYYRGKLKLTGSDIRVTSLPMDEDVRVAEDVFSIIRERFELI